ncbi:cytochrome c [Ideonella sp. 4Y11]|uniref:Cytochrome c n=1 Tax=Ideonella aquatica TaxID=2824119 RepID=A0A940YRB7_9BURK|nr:cytochrome c [Ideonella aquatica]MBQ0960563.1 cytochrome c [Ideonella aquatica]
MKRLALALTCATLFAALPAHAQFQKPEDAIKYRKGAFTVMASHFGRIGAMASGKAPFDAGAAQANAEIVNTLARLPFTAFAEGTGSGDTRAKPEIWTDAAKFKDGSQAMIDAVGKLNAAAKTGNLDQIKAAFGDAGKTCKACHDNFRKE